MANHTETLQFLKEIFPDFGCRAIFANLNPADHTRDYSRLDLLRDCYWSIAAFPDDGSATRTLARAVEVRALVVDDVGTKVPPGNVRTGLGKPTAVVETSLGNFQWVYRLAAPIAVEAWGRFVGQVEGLIGARLEGPDAVHLFRLPCGVNTKKQRGGFKPRLAELNAGVTLNSSCTGAASIIISPPAAIASGPGPRVRNIGGLVALLPNDTGVDREGWTTRAHQIKALALDETAGWQAFEAWSERWTGGAYDAAATRKMWDSIRETRTSGLELRAEVQAADPDGFARVMNGEAREVFDDGVSHAAALTAGRYDAAQVDMAEHIIGVEQQRLGWLHEAPKIWLGFDPVTHRWMRSGEDLLRGVVWEEITRRRMVGVDSKTARSMKSGAWHAAVTGLLVKNPKLRLSPDLFDANKDMLGLPLGVMEIDIFGRGVIRRGRASDYITKSTAVMPAAAGTKSAVWEKFLDEFTCGDLELRIWLQVYMGYCLTGHTLHERVIFVYGAGGSGKGVFFGTCGAVMGDYATEAGQATFMQKGRGPAPHSTDLAVLEGLRMVVVPEVPDNAAWDMELIKRISGGDLIAARRMFQDQRAWRPQLKLIVVGNDQPEIAKVDDAVRRRLLTVWARYKAPVCDEQLKTRMRTVEGPAVLRWMVDGWEMWEAAGRRLPICKAIADASKTYLTASDVFGRWKEECLERVQDVNACVRVKDVFDSWSAFKMNEGAMILAPNASKNLMTRLNEGETKPFQTRRDHSGAFVIVGLKLNKSVSSTVF